ncbi:MAG: hypothetical protein J6Q14_08390 [Oscillospiraceae bacterium]|nr:hypothetical protein [Oscillospiraceae bacterium]
MPSTELNTGQIRQIVFYRAVATNWVGGLYPADDLYPSSTLYPASNGYTASANSNAAQITIYPQYRVRSDNPMITFTDKSLFLKGVGNVILTDPDTGDILYQSKSFNAGSVSTSVNMNEIRAGLGNPVVATLPSDASLTVEFTAVDFSLFEKAAQVGAALTYGAPVPVAQTIKATGTSLTIDVTDGVPAPQLGFSEAVCYIQPVGAASPIIRDGTAYPISEAGVISGFTATVDQDYKVWYFVQKATAHKATIGSLMDPKIVHFSASFAVYANVGGSANSGTRVGWLYVTVPKLKMQANANISGDQTNADTTVITGMALSEDDQVVSATTYLCGDVSNPLAYYVYSPCNDAEIVQGIAVVGGLVSLPISSVKQIPVYLVMPDNTLVKPTSYSTGFTYTGSGLPTGTSVSTAGVVSSGTATGDGECLIEWTDGENEFSCPVNISVVSA